MQNHTQKRLVEINKQFYKNVAHSFSKSRQYSWAGWEVAFEELDKHKFLPSSILDIGCGNGRFLNFLITRYPEFNYLGIDNSKKLLEDAVKSHALVPSQYSAEFQETDITDPKELSSVRGSFDLIVMMAVLHHIPGEESRKSLLNSIVEKLNNLAILVFTTWNFMEEPTLASKVTPWGSVGINTDELEKGDHLLDWNSDKKLLRYCHYFEKVEIERLIQELPVKGLGCFDSDGRNGKLNSYFLLQKL